MPVIQKTKYECFSRIVISSEVEKSSLQNDNRRMRESRNMPFWGITPFRHPERRETSYVRVRMPEQLRPEPKDRGEAATFIPHYNSHFFSLLQFFLKSAILNA